MCRRVGRLQRFKGLPGRFKEVLAMRSIATAALLSFIATAASAAGTVNVTFVDPDSFYDAGNSKRDVPGNLNELELHLQQLGQKYLPDGQVLSISVLDVDLAGYMNPLSSRAGREVRIARREANWPRFKIRYTLEAPGQPVKNVEEV